MDLSQLKYFKTVANAKTIAKAAQELFLSAPALSIAISRLEKELGVALFDRSGNRITLNAQGEIFLRHVDKIFETLDQARNEMAHSILRQRQQIWVATTGSNPWMELIMGFSQEFPQYPLTCSSIIDTPISNIFSQYTFLLAESDEVPESCVQTLEHISLFEDHPAILVHPDHPLSRLDLVHVSMLQGETLFLPIPGMRRRDRLIRLLEDGGIDIDSTTATNYVIYRSMVEENMGIAFTTTRSHHTNLGSLKVIPLEHKLSHWQMNLYWQANHTFTPAELLFRDFAKQVYQA